MKRNTLSSGMLADWVKAAIDAWPEGSQAELSRQLTKKLRRRIDSAAVNKILKSERAVAADEMLAIAEITGYPVLISLGGEILSEEFIERKQGINEKHLVKLFELALRWRGLPADQARFLSGALLGAATRHPDRPSTELTDDQLQGMLDGLVAASALPRPQ